MRILENDLGTHPRALVHFLYSLCVLNIGRLLPLLDLFILAGYVGKPTLCVFGLSLILAMWLIDFIFVPFLF